MNFKREVKVIKMTKEAYMNQYGNEYNEGNLFDYPFNEMDHIVNDTEITVVAFIDDRLFEVPQ